MKPSVLFVRGRDSVAKGYIDALRHIGHKVYVCQPQTKSEVRQLIEEYRVRLIFTESKYGVRQLSPRVINDNQVSVVVRALPMNKKNLTLTNPYDHADPHEIPRLLDIDRLAVWTPVIESLWPDYMHGWLDANVELLYLPYAGNLLRKPPKGLRTMVDVTIPSAAAQHPMIEMIIRRLQVFKKTYGDCDYGNAGICLNLHPEPSFINESVFNIPIAGGAQIVFARGFVKDYLGDCVDVARTPKDLALFVDEYTDDRSLRFLRTKEVIEKISINHSYFSRLHELFKKLSMPDVADDVLRTATRVGYKYSWDLKARLSAEEKGENYEAANVLASPTR